MAPPEPQANQDAAGAEPAELAAPELEQLRQDLSMAQDRALRAQAELENFRKRSRRELDDSLRYASLPLLRDLLGVIDNLDRAIEAARRKQRREEAGAAA